MEKQIITGTKIIFKETNEKFTLTQTETGFDVRQIKLSKNVPAEPYSFQEFLDKYENGEISIEGFEETDASLVRSIVTNYIYNTTLKSQLVQMDELTAKNAELTSNNTELISKNEELTVKNAELEKRITSLEETISNMQEA